MNAINFDTGLVRFTVNDCYEMTFNPTDSNFAEKLYNVFNILHDKQDEYKTRVESAGSDNRKIFGVVRELDGEMRELVDSVAGPGASDQIFGTMNLYALAGGLPVWANLLLSIMDELDTAFTREQKLTNPRIKKYLDRYDRTRGAKNDL